MQKLASRLALVAGMTLGSLATPTFAVQGPQNTIVDLGANANARDLPDLLFNPQPMVPSDPLLPNLQNMVTPSLLSSYAGMPVTLVDMAQFMPSDVLFVELDPQDKFDLATQLHDHLLENAPDLAAGLDAGKSAGKVISTYMNIIETMESSTGSMVVDTQDGKACIVYMDAIAMNAPTVTDAMAATVNSLVCSGSYSTMSLGVGTQFPVSAFQMALVLADENGITQGRMDDYIAETTWNGGNTGIFVAQYMALSRVTANKDLEPVATMLSRAALTFYDQVTAKEAEGSEALGAFLLENLNSGRGINSTLAYLKIRADNPDLFKRPEYQGYTFDMYVDPNILPGVLKPASLGTLAPQ